METNAYFLFIAIIGLLLVGYLIWLDRRRLRLLKLRVKKMYGSPLFQDLAPILRAAQIRPIESLRVDKTGITVRYVHPAGSETRFNISKQGYRPLSPERQEALMALLEEFLPKITDSNRYVLRKKRIRLLNGQTEYYHQYTIVNGYKNSLVRAPYYDRSFRHSHLW